MSSVRNLDRFSTSPSVSKLMMNFSHALHSPHPWMAHPASFRHQSVGCCFAPAIREIQELAMNSVHLRVDTSHQVSHGRRAATTKVTWHRMMAMHRMMAAAVSANFAVERRLRPLQSMSPRTCIVGTCARGYWNLDILGHPLHIVEEMLKP